MFGYARPDWRDGYRGWEYIDTIADDNPLRDALRERSPQRRGRPGRLRARTTWAGWSARPSPAPTT